ncbi:MAG: helix-turn-helix domain-containing protein [Ilumatobacter fluminis]|uniref:winged helix-turn-helix transcriptional regulator n=1 Tax=Ilumatobacter fluminis TaxID=467091 RepID=UPI0032EE5E26
MKLTELGEQRCPMAQALGEIGDAWSLLILREAFYGRRRFSEFVEHTEAQKTVVSARLKQLVGAGILEREQYSEAPTRHHYVLTEKGRDLAGVMVMLTEWGRRWVDRDEPEVSLVHAPCEHDLRPQLQCAECGDRVADGSITARFSRHQTGSPG